MTISGTKVGNITGARVGISAGGNLTIDGTVKVGNISGGSSVGIYVYGGNLLITPSAEVGNITGIYGIAVYKNAINIGGGVEITGRVGNITGTGAYDMFADVKYAVLDYIGSILRIAKCSPTGYTVTFNYGPTYPPNVPKCAYISGGNLIPDFALLNATDWYTDSALTPANQWIFVANTVNVDTILYASWPASFTGTILPNATVGSYYSQTPAVAGSAPITWALAIGSILPDGLSFDANTGVISGTPTTTGTWTFDVTVSNSIPSSETQTLTLTVVAVPPAPPAFGGGGGTPYIPKTPVGEAQKPTFPIGGQVVGKRITVFKLEALKTTLFRLNKGEAFTVLGLANGGRALFIEHNGRQGYIALKDIGITFEPPIKATAFKKAPVYSKLENGKLKRIGYYSVQQSLWIHGISGKYLINKQTGVTYYLDAGQWVLVLP